jgi:hypothetical protein
MEAEGWLNSIEKKLEIAQCNGKYFLQRVNYLEPLLIGGRRTVTLTRISVLVAIGTLMSDARRY